MNFKIKEKKKFNQIYLIKNTIFKKKKTLLKIIKNFYNLQGMKLLII